MRLVGGSGMGVGAEWVWMGDGGVEGLVGGWQVEASHQDTHSRQRARPCWWWWGARLVSHTALTTLAALTAADHQPRRP